MIYSNLPPATASASSSDATNKAFDQYNDIPVELDQNMLTAMTGMLENRGFSRDSSESISITVMIQAKRDGYNPMTVLESMKKLNENDLSQLLSEILNYNRLKTSVLGSIQKITPVDNVQRNIVA
jgi:TPP-dependent indolepyruvate ferredoxin oxidoreductase alpha subunit